ncbi:MAG: prefoldin subunit beta [Nanoarchaeota archaeon]
MDKDTQEKITKLQMMEQNLQNLLAQRQQFTTQLAEIEGAVKELDTKEPVYKLVGNILVKSEPAKLKEELSQKKELVELRIKSLEKQENQMRDRSSQLKEEVMKTISKEQ